MTKTEAVQKVVSNLSIRGVVIDCDYDPAGSTTTYAPDPKWLEALSTLADRPVNVDKDLWFRVGGFLNGTYGVLDSLLKDIKV